METAECLNEVQLIMNYIKEKRWYLRAENGPNSPQTTVLKQCFKGIGSQVSRWKPNLKSHC